MECVRTEGRGRAAGAVEGGCVGGLKRGVTAASEHGLELLEPRTVEPSPRPPDHTSEKVCFVLNEWSNLTTRLSTPTGKMVFVLRRG